MIITLYNNSSEPNKISKHLTPINMALSGSLRNESEIVNPVVLIEGDISSLQNANYARIEAFGRYYYITEMKSVRSNIVELHLHTDVLMSFNLSAVTGIVIETESVELSNYLTGRNWVETVKHKTDIKTFPSGLLDTGEYILITAGGGS